MIKYYDCDIVGHKRSDCPNKKEDKASEKTQQSSAREDSTTNAVQ